MQNTTKNTPGLPERRRVVVVDNDPIMRAGTRSILEADPRIDLVAAVDHDTALSWTAEWAEVDVAIVDASDQRRDGDQFPGVGVVRSIRRLGVPVATVVLTGQYLHPGLRRRMWEAGADFFFPRDEGMTEAELASVVLNPDEHRRMRHAQISLPGGLGVTRETMVNDLVERLGAEELRNALASERRKKSDPHGERSRWWNQLRRLAGGPAGLVPVKASGAQAVDIAMPSVVQLRKFWTAMTRADTSSPG
jgi:CheY-like chemotaxis protein